jgi:hypothetical protein
LSPGKVERLGEFLVARINQFVRHARGRLDPLGEQLLHEGFGVYHVVEAVRLHGIAEEAVILHERVDGLHLRNVGLVILGIPFDHRVVLGDRLGQRRVGLQHLVAGHRADHRSLLEMMLVIRISVCA